MSNPCADAATEISMTNNRPKKITPPNSLRHYRERAGLTLEEVAKGANTNHQTIQRLEVGKMRLTSEWAHRIGTALRVPHFLLGFSDSPHVYPWAASAVPVVGRFNSELRIEYSPEPLGRIGVTNRTATTVAVEITDEALPEMRGWMILYDTASRERMSPLVIQRQTSATKFISRTKDGGTWWRDIVPSHRRGYYHLEASKRRAIYDVEIEWVTEITGLDPGQKLPPIDSNPDWTTLEPNSTT